MNRVPRRQETELEPFLYMLICSPAIPLKYLKQLLARAKASLYGSPVKLSLSGGCCLTRWQHCCCSGCTLVKNHKPFGVIFVLQSPDSTVQFNDWLRTCKPPCLSWFFGGGFFFPTMQLFTLHWGKHEFAFAKSNWIKCSMRYDNNWEADKHFWSFSLLNMSHENRNITWNRLH